jgi:hypothetical protein
MLRGYEGTGEGRGCSTPPPSRLFYPLLDSSYIRWQRSHRWRQTLPRQAPLPLLAL